MAKKQKKQDEKLASTWLNSYADLVTILFAMFVMLFALSDVSEEALAEFAMAWTGQGAPSVLDFGGDSIHDLLGNGIMYMPMLVTVAFEAPVGQQDGQNGAGESTYEVVAEVLRTYFGETAFAETIDVVSDPDTGVVISFYDGMLFPSGSSFLQPDTIPLLEVVGNEIANFPELHITIEGHTDNVPIGTAPYPNNWWLSNARANRVLDFFYTGPFNIEPHRLLAVGRGEYSPIADNYTEAGRSLNRRVEIRLFEP